ncbi:hypothetical protein ONE63_000648 [Megalurothrips usitatus]|uniref:Uncharacterized protein n=1 Tax=Megalurothrips usitatus TaxID=439358 RepID=A0AAV7Y305_9NEOP|nr:hypothetical protein ONE63_000648 [Megalurothrips usitatus]
MNTLLCALLLLGAAVLAADSQAPQPLLEAKKATQHKTSPSPSHKTKPTTRKPAHNATATTATTTRVKPTLPPPSSVSMASMASSSTVTAAGTTLPAVPATEAPTTIMDSTASTAAATRDSSGVGYSPARRETPVPPQSSGPQVSPRRAPAAPSHGAATGQPRDDTASSGSYMKASDCGARGGAGRPGGRERLASPMRSVPARSLCNGCRHCCGLRARPAPPAPASAILS